MKIFFGALLFDGERMIEDHALLVEGDRIVGMTPYAERPRQGEAVDLGGGVLAPGLIDWQVNGGGGVLFNETPTVEGVAAIVKAHRGDGTTSLLPTLITDAPAKLDAALAAAREAQKSVPGALGVHVEGPFIDIRRKGAHPAEFIRVMTDADADKLIAAKAEILLVTLAPAAVSNELIAKLA